MDLLLRHLQTEPLVNKALKGAALGASVGLCWWVGKQMFPTSTTVSLFEELSEDANQSLASDPEVRVLCQRFKIYARHEPDAYTTLLQNWSALIQLYVQLVRREIKPRMMHPRLVSTYVSHIVEAERRLRAFVQLESQNNASTLSAFDEIASDFQRKCNEYTHNITKTVEYEQML